MEPFQCHKSDFKGQNLGVHLDDTPGSLDEDETGEEEPYDAVVAGVVRVAVDHLVGSDDDDAGEGGDECTALQNPVPAHFSRACTQLDNGGGPWRKEEDCF